MSIKKRWQVQSLDDSNQESPSLNATFTSSKSDRIESLPWRSVKIPESVLSFGDDIGGLVSFEVIDGVDVIHSLSDHSNIVQFKALTPEEIAALKMERKMKSVDKKKTDKKPESKVKEVKNLDEKDKKSNNKRKATEKSKETLPLKRSKIEKVDSEPVDTSAWTIYGLDDKLIQALGRKGFSKPTRIQHEVLSFAMHQPKRDLFGCAETGSGKSLAFGLPILQSILAKEWPLDEQGRIQCPDLVALILTPTRELCLQVCDHLYVIGKPLGIRIVSVVGGMAVQKQERLLQQQPNVIVATPGRLWELVSDPSMEEEMLKLKQVSYLVIDEADKMLEVNRFKELHMLLQFMNRQKVQENEEAEQVFQSVSHQRSTYIFSATLLEQSANVARPSKGKKQQQQPSLSLLYKKLQCRDKEPHIINATDHQQLSAHLHEWHLDCVKEDKDLILYWFLLAHPGRTLVFVNSIDCIRRLVGLFTLLKLPVMGLHAQMQQRQRLKNLDRFKANENVILIASDVAARGLDIEQVQHVVHYHIPHSVDIYVHRRGRTARAGRSGHSLCLVAPNETNAYRALCRSLEKPNGMDTFESMRVTHRSLLQQRLRLALDLEKAQHKERKVSSEQSWRQKAAKALEIELSDEEESDSDNESAHKKKDKKYLQQMLDAALEKPLPQ